MLFGAVQQRVGIKEIGAGAAGQTKLWVDHQMNADHFGGMMNLQDLIKVFFTIGNGYRRGCRSDFYEAVFHKDLPFCGQRQSRLPLCSSSIIQLFSSNYNTILKFY